MKFRSVNRRLEQKVSKWLDYLYSNRQVLNEEKVLNSDLSVELRKDLAIQVHLESLQRVKLFDDCETNLLVELVRRSFSRDENRASRLGQQAQADLLRTGRLHLSQGRHRQGDVHHQTRSTSRGQWWRDNYVCRAERRIGVRRDLHPEYSRFEERQSSYRERQIVGLFGSLHSSQRRPLACLG